MFLHMFLCSLWMKLNKNKRDKNQWPKICVCSQLNREKQQSSVSKRIRPMTLKRWAWVEARVGEKMDAQCTGLNVRDLDIYFFCSSFLSSLSFSISSFRSIFAHSLCISISPFHLSVYYLKCKSHLSALVTALLSSHALTIHKHTAYSALLKLPI